MKQIGFYDIAMYPSKQLQLENSDILCASECIYVFTLYNLSKKSLFNRSVIGVERARGYRDCLEDIGYEFIEAKYI